VPAPSEAEVRGYLKSLSNWGRWGSEDELGTVNLITPARRQAAARLVTTGESVTCARPITTDITADTTVQPLRFMVDSGEGRDTVSPERALQRRGAAEFIGMVFHGYSITTWTRRRTTSGTGSSTTAARATPSPRARAPP
jgi:hypothetical protein